MTLNTTSIVKVDDQDLPITEKFTYLRSSLTPDGGSKEDIQSRLSKARNAFNSMSIIWKSCQYSTRTKLNSYVLPVLLYGAECWRMTQQDLAKLSTFHSKNLRRILKIFWPKKISNEDLMSRCNHDDMGTIIMKKRWR